MAKKHHTVPKYVRKIRYLQRIGALPSDVGVHWFSVYHDDWCQHWTQPGHCNCDPDIRLRWSHPANGAH